MKLIACQDLTVCGCKVAAGDQFEQPDSEGAVLIRKGWAEAAKAPKPKIKRKPKEAAEGEPE